jgi:O-antigen ligase
VLLLASKIDLRVRDPGLALEGVADTEIMVELGIWAAIGAWVLFRLCRPLSWLMHAFPSRLGPALQWYGLIAVMSAMSALLLRGAPLPVVRALQLMVIVALAVLIQRDVRWQRARTLDVWTGAGRVLVVAVLGLMALGVLFPQLTFGYETYYGYSRYRLLQMQPIGSAQLIGLALVACASNLLVSARSDRFQQLLFLGAGLVLAAGLWGTKARGALLATVVAVGVVALLTPLARRRGVLVLAGALASVPVLGGLFDDALRTTLLRGQTEQELLSLTGRTELFGYAWRLFAERPVTGHGYFSARELFLARFPWAGESHNAVVDIALSLGLVGLVLYLALFVTVVVSLRKGLHQPGEGRELAAIGIALLSWLLLDGVGSDSYGGAVGVGVLALVLVALIADELRDRDQGQDDRQAPAAAPAPSVRDGGPKNVGSSA